MRRFCAILWCALALPLYAITPCAGYETTRDMPLYYESLREELTFPDAWGNSDIADYGEWREYARSLLLDCLQYSPDTTAFDYEIVASENRGSYTAHLIHFNISRYVRVPAYLLLPHGDGPFPAVTLLHDHGAKFDIGKEKSVRPMAHDTVRMASADAWVKRYYDEVYVGDYMAQKGYVVLAVDALLWGDRGRKEGSKYDSQQALSANLLQLGKSWCGVITADDVRSVEFLATLPCVDADRIGAVGFSMGAHRAWMLSAVTDVVKASAAVCWMCTTDSLMTLTNNQIKGGSAYAMIVPRLRSHLDYPHVAAIACPKPMLFINGKQDKLFPLEGVEEAYAYLHNVWDECEADAKLRTTLYDTGHIFNRAMLDEVLQFMNDNL